MRPFGAPRCAPTMGSVFEYKGVAHAILRTNGINELEEEIRRDSDAPIADLTARLWFSGRMPRCRRGGPGSIPGRRRLHLNC